ncbi:30S ribosomal protein S8 [Listeria monocytogenes]|nr:30S ribosomal protein S8 [Listeria monocytogenes]GAM96222.1 30S ribosomal protein S8 [Listeria monocytogenes]GAT36660.1 30S ribosomal protein S8 [Listeria monocytogenes]GAT39622.1 30S ribosomal protein S8 [Listeria monocytogenes]GAT41866.1 30S ribosomal protein S8 [Listeria monocytogenes]
MPSILIVISGLNSFTSSPLGPLTVAVDPLSVTVTPAGITIVFLPIRDIYCTSLWFTFSYQTYASTSPPTCLARASLSVKTPWEVDTIAIPRPLSTLGTSVDFAYTRKPGLLIRFKPVITRSPVAPYFKKTRIVPALSSSIYSTSRIKPSRFNISAISFLILDAGSSNLSCLTMFALRMRVRKSAIGSVITMYNTLLP